jgi:hypothetical protein
VVGGTFDKKRMGLSISFSKVAALGNSKENSVRTEKAVGGLKKRRKSIGQAECTHMKRELRQKGKGLDCLILFDRTDSANVPYVFGKDDEGK